MASMASSGATLVVVIRRRTLLMASIRAKVVSGVLCSANAASWSRRAALTRSTAFGAPARGELNHQVSR